jgi:hypothetical protein
MSVHTSITRPNRHCVANSYSTVLPIMCPLSHRSWLYLFTSASVYVRAYVLSHSVPGPNPGIPGSRLFSSATPNVATGKRATSSLDFHVRRQSNIVVAGALGFLKPTFARMDSQERARIRSIDPSTRGATSSPSLCCVTLWFSYLASRISFVVRSAQAGCLSPVC